MPRSLDSVKDDLARKYPGVRLTFGYIGNCGVDRKGSFDDRYWMFFTSVPRPLGQSQGGCFSYRIGETEFKKGVENDPLKVEEFAYAVEKWLVEKVIPYQREVYRCFRVKVGVGDHGFTERLLLEKGASFGYRGSELCFSIQYQNIETLRQMLPWAIEIREEAY